MGWLPFQPQAVTVQVLRVPQLFLLGLPRGLHPCPAARLARMRAACDTANGFRTYNLQASFSCSRAISWPRPSLFLWLQTLLWFAACIYLFVCLFVAEVPCRHNEITNTSYIGLSICHSICLSLHSMFIEYVSISRKTECLNHEGWKRPLRSSSPAVHLPPACPLNQVPQCHISMFLGHLQGWWLHSLPEQPVSIPHLSFW